MNADFFTHQLRETAGKKKAVEQRKISKNYLDFIKSSQRFYRGYIHKLNVRFDGIPELEAVAKKFNLDGMPPPSNTPGWSR